MKTKERLFGDMTLDEIEKWEMKANGVVFFGSVEERGFAFHKSISGDTALILQIDGIKNPIILFNSQIERLKDYLNSNF